MSQSDNTTREELYAEFCNAIQPYENMTENGLLGSELGIITQSSSDYAPETLQLLVKFVRNDAEKEHGMWLYIMVTSSTKEARIREAITYDNHIQRMSSDFPILESLTEYHQLPTLDDYSTVDANLKKKIGALLEVTTTLDYHRNLIDPYGKEPTSLPLRYFIPNYDHVVLSEDQLIDLIMSRPEDSLRIAQIIIERNTADATLIASILDTEPTLSNGPL